MGLDMYLTGDKFTPNHDGKHQRQKVDSYEVTSLRLDLGQWRKHWALHNYIDLHYSDSERHEISLDPNQLLEIAEAVEQGRLPDASLFDPVTDAHYKEPEQVAKTAKIFRDASAWLQRDDGFCRDVEFSVDW